MEYTFQQLNYMLIGEYTHLIDEKKRISLPSKFRSEIGKKIVITYGLENCLSIYSIKEWQKISEKLSEHDEFKLDTRSFNRFMFGGAVEVEIDSLGRILMPDHLKEYSDLKNKVVFIGVHSRIELWSDENWREYKKKVVKQVDMLAEKLGKAGAH